MDMDKKKHRPKSSCCDQSERCVPTTMTFRFALDRRDSPAVAHPRKAKDPCYSKKKGFLGGKARGRATRESKTTFATSSDSIYRRDEAY